MPKPLKGMLTEENEAELEAKAFMNEDLQEEIGRLKNFKAPGVGIIVAELLKFVNRVKS